VESIVLNTLIQSNESETIEFEKCLNKISGSVFETVCAFLNRKGGHLFIGVTDDKKIIGVNEKCVFSINYSGVNTNNTMQETVGKTVGKTVGETVGKTVGEILKLIEVNPKITRDELAKKTGLSVRGIEWNLKKMKDQNIIRRIGPDKGGYWEIINKNK